MAYLGTEFYDRRPPVFTFYSIAAWETTEDNLWWVANNAIRNYTDILMDLEHIDEFLTSSNSKALVNLIRYFYDYFVRLRQVMTGPDNRESLRHYLNTLDDWLSWYEDLFYNDDTFEVRPQQISSLSVIELLVRIMLDRAPLSNDPDAIFSTVGMYIGLIYGLRLLTIPFQTI
jgi:hypothetical protein